MTEHFPAVTAREIVRALERLGFSFDRQHGSHAYYRHPVSRRIVSVPMHSGDVKRGLVFGIQKQSGCSREEFIAAL